MFRLLFWSLSFLFSWVFMFSFPLLIFPLSCLCFSWFHFILDDYFCSILFIYFPDILDNFSLCFFLSVYYSATFPIYPLALNRSTQKGMYTYIYMCVWVCIHTDTDTRVRMSVSAQYLHNSYTPKYTQTNTVSATALNKHSHVNVRIFTKLFVTRFRMSLTWRLSVSIRNEEQNSVTSGV